MPVRMRVTPPHYKPSIKKVVGGYTSDMARNASYAQVRNALLNLISETVSTIKDEDELETIRLEYSALIDQRYADDMISFADRNHLQTHLFNKVEQWKTMYGVGR